MSSSVNTQNKSHIVYPGSFDPVTKGHLDVIRRLASSFDRLTVLVADSHGKNQAFSISDRIEMIKEVLGSSNNVEVEGHKGLLVDYLKERGLNLIARSLRSSADWDHESTMAHANKKLFNDVETYFVVSSPDFAHISSSLVKEIAANGGDLREFVDPRVEKRLKEKMNKK